MHIVVVGLNYRTAPVEVREQFAFAEQDLPEALHQLMGTKSVLEGVVVATCNRTEIYVVVDRLHMCGYFIRSFMEQWFGVRSEQFTQHMYIYEDEQAMAHLFRVTCGLDSMVIGETQILGQVRSAFLTAQGEGATGTWFNKLFKQAVTLGKRAHSETSIGESAVSVSYAAVELGKRIFGMFTGKRVLILGAGKMSELTVKHLYSSGAAEVIVANRTLSRAAELAEKFSGKPSTIEDALKHLDEVDIVISSTGAAGYVLTAQQVAEGMKRRPSRPLFMIDIAVPRDIDPEAANVSGVFLYDIDDLEGIVESNLEMRRSEAAKIEVMIGEEMDEFQLWLKTLGVRPVIRALQDKSNAIHEETMESLFNKLPELDEHQRKVIRRLTKSIVNQMMHDPINVIKEMSGGKQGSEALDYFSKIFALQGHIDEGSQGGGSPSTSQAHGKQVTGAAANVVLPGTTLAPAGLLGR
ncbi:glutamyl-tRNA reductase [Bacillus sp. FJAT-27264]|uniref:glutamyl-tRNA reductase n=1 Tax=Paenibacillus sp. (strain DSM 101736 / FJAT-27264) TaxID=1850362 RepID=UPI0008080B1E|nr:glutamyl-tRNA reductase [Bacillus sp. FJAT-27264]OBZ09831.1 glutamyl-tRNA reductase [Bacillus sp. FJAT-27264]